MVDNVTRFLSKERIKERIKKKRRCRAFVLACVYRYGGWILEYASGMLKNDFIITKAAVRQDGNALQHASEELQGNYDIVMEAVKHNGAALQYASEELQNDPRVLVEAINQKRLALQSAQSQVWQKGLVDASDHYRENLDTIQTKKRVKFH
ncbi:MAG: hypothetical protein CL916_03245 [Deltaproteobacteria bacterium]|nr:hypothetical protein [Deltaproteobacteria bacterium]